MRTRERSRDRELCSIRGTYGITFEEVPFMARRGIGVKHRPGYQNHSYLLMWDFVPGNSR